MGAKELFDSGNLQATIEQLVQDVKNKPLDLHSRIFLFESLCFAGDLQRAERQLDAIAQTSGDVNVEMGVMVYRSVLQAEKKRAALLTGSRSLPKFISEPPNYAALHIEAIARMRDNNAADVERLLEESENSRGPLKGQKDGTPFSDFKDADDILGPFLEVFFQSEYFWVPFSDIKELSLQPPRTLRDLLWIPARIDLDEKPLGDVLIPVQYYDSCKDGNDLVKLGRMTDWKTFGEGTLLGAGQRTFLADDSECPLLEVRKIAFSKEV